MAAPLFCFFFWHLRLFDSYTPMFYRRDGSETAFSPLSSLPPRRNPNTDNMAILEDPCRYQPNPPLCCELAFQVSRHRLAMGAMQPAAQPPHGFLQVSVRSACFFNVEKGTRSFDRRSIEHPTDTFAASREGRCKPTVVRKMGLSVSSFLLPSFSVGMKERLPVREKEHPALVFGSFHFFSSPTFPSSSESLALSFSRSLASPFFSFRAHFTVRNHDG